MHPEIHGYALHEKLGSGGSGSVYRATQTATGDAVALKLIETQGEHADELIARAQQEASLSWAINHPNVVRVVSWGFHDGGVHIAQQLLRGESLGEKLRRQRTLSVAETTLIARQILRGLAAVHARDAVHRDIKPDNIYLAQEHGQLNTRILDLGIARLSESDPNRCFETARGFTVGTPGYMSPEQIMGDPVDARADLFSLGVVMYECLTGALPVTGESPQAIAIATVRRSGHAELPETVPRAVREFVNWLMEPSAARRPSNVEVALCRLDDAMGQRSSPSKTTVVLSGVSTEIGDLTIPRLGDWTGHRRFREYLISAVLKLFRPGEMPSSLTAQFHHAETLEQLTKDARATAAEIVRESGRLARTWSNRAASAQAVVDAESAARERARTHYVECTVAVEREALLLAELDAEYGRGYRELERAQGRAVGQRTATNRGVPLEAMLGDEVADCFARIDGLQQRREVQMRALDEARGEQLAARAAVASTDAKLIEAKAKLATTAGRQRIEVDAAELRVHEAEVKLMRLEQSCEHAYLRAGVMVQAALAES